MTQFIGVASSALLGNKQYYRLTFEARSQAVDRFFWTAEQQLSYMYDHIQDTGVLGPLSAYPAVSGDAVMVIDAWTIGDAATVTVAEGVRRLDMVGGGHATVRSIQKLAGIGDVTGGAQDRQDITQAVTAAKAADNPLNIFGSVFSGIGNGLTLAVIGLVAYAVIVFSKGAAGRKEW